MSVLICLYFSGDIVTCYDLFVLDVQTFFFFHGSSTSVYAPQILQYTHHNT